MGNFCCKATVEEPEIQTQLRGSEVIANPPKIKTLLFHSQKQSKIVVAPKLIPNKGDWDGKPIFSFDFQENEEKPIKKKKFQPLQKQKPKDSQNQQKSKPKPKKKSVSSSDDDDENFKVEMPIKKDFVEIPNLIRWSPEDKEDKRRQLDMKGWIDISDVEKDEMDWKDTIIRQAYTKSYHQAYDTFGSGHVSYNWRTHCRGTKLREVNGHQSKPYMNHLNKRIVKYDSDVAAALKDCVRGFQGQSGHKPCSGFEMRAVKKSKLDVYITFFSEITGAELEKEKEIELGSTFCFLLQTRQDYKNDAKVKDDRLLD